MLFRTLEIYKRVSLTHHFSLFSGSSAFVFPAGTIAGHLHKDSISKAIRNLGGKDKYNGKALFAAASL